MPDQTIGATSCDVCSEPVSEHVDADVHRCTNCQFPQFAAELDHNGWCATCLEADE